MHTGGRYTKQLVGSKKNKTGGKNVTFTVQTKVADETTDLTCGSRRRAEVAFTAKGTIVGRKLLVCCDKMNGSKREEQYQTFKTLAEASKWFEKKYPEEARVQAALKGWTPPPPPPEEI